MTYNSCYNSYKNYKISYLNSAFQELKDTEQSK